MLLALAVAMGVLAWRYSRKLDRSRFHPLVLGAVGLAGVSAVGGAGVMTNAKAIDTIPVFAITDALLRGSGGRVTETLTCGEPKRFENDSSGSVTVLSIQVNDPSYQAIQLPEAPCTQGSSLDAGGFCEMAIFCEDEFREGESGQQTPEGGELEPIPPEFLG